MKKRLSLLVLLLLLALPVLGTAADAGFESVCTLLAEAAEGINHNYTLLEQGLDAIELVAQGKLTASEASGLLGEIINALLTTRAVQLAPATGLMDYMTQKGYSIVEFQVVATSAQELGVVYAESLVPYLSLLEPTGDAVALDTSYARQTLDFEKKIDFYALNTLLLPTSDEEAEAVSRLLIDKTPYLKATGLAWERDMNVCAQKLEVLFTQYEELISATELAIFDAADDVDMLETGLGM